MIPDSDLTASADILETLDRLNAEPSTEANCMFQLAIMLARVALEPISETYRERAEQAMLGLIRSKPRSNVVRLFNAPQAIDAPASRSYATA